MFLVTKRTGSIHFCICEERLMVYYQPYISKNCHVFVLNFLQGKFHKTLKKVRVKSLHFVFSVKPKTFPTNPKTPKSQIPPETFNFSPKCKEKRRRRTLYKTRKEWNWIDTKVLKWQETLFGEFCGIVKFWRLFERFWSFGNFVENGLSFQLEKQSSRGSVGKALKFWRALLNLSFSKFHLLYRGQVNGYA